MANNHPLDAPWSVWNCVSRLQISWLWTLLSKGASKTLTEDDVWPAPRRLSAAELGPKVEKLWEIECKIAEGHPSLARVLGKLVADSLGYFVGLSLICGCCFIIAPICLKNFLEEFSETLRLTPLCLWGFSFSLCFATISICVSISKYYAQVAGMICRVATQRLIYCSCLQMPADSLADLESPTNLMSVDAERYFVFFNSIMPHAYLLVFAFPVLLVSQLGLVPAAVCMACALSTTYISKVVSRMIFQTRRNVMAESDRRMQLSEQYLEGIRVLKMNSWTAVANERLAHAREAELRHHRSVLFWKGVNLMISLVSPCICGFGMFVSYALLGGKMTPEVVFPALTVLRSLQLMMGIWPMSFAAWAEIRTSHARVCHFLASTPPRRTEAPAEYLALEQVTLKRGLPFSEAKTAHSQAVFELGPIDLSLSQGDFCVVCGPVASGKSTLLLGLLGELLPSSGKARIPSARIALCAQEPWITSATVRDNIRCLRDQDQDTYQLAVQAAQLLPDFKALPGADSTEIGSRGINISGGQKARVALARALCSKPAPEVIFLDDVLSAVDVHVAQSIIQDALLGTLRHSTRILVANTFLPLLLPHAQRVVVLGQGRVEAVGSPKEAFASSAWLRQAVESMGGCNMDAPASTHEEAPEKAASTEGALKGGVAPVSGNSVSAQNVELSKTANGSLLVAEDRAIGVLSFQTYVAYFRQATSEHSMAVGVLLFTCVLVLVMLAEAARTSTEIWVTAWTRSSEQDILYWVSGYTVILMILFLLTLTRTLLWMRLIVRIGERIHRSMIRSILGASVPAFFDVVPTGRILNRFSKDLDSLDSQLPDFMSEFFQGMTYVVASAVLCCSISSYTLILLVPLMAMFAYIRKFYSATSRQLKRMEAVSRSPLYVHFQESLSGLVHIRAFGLQKALLLSFQEKVDTNNKLFYHQYTMIPFLVYRVNMLATTVTAMMTALVILLRTSMDPSLVGLGFSSAAGLIGRLHQCVQMSTEVENHFTSVERLEHFHHVTQEADGQSQVKSAWPQRGEVRFEAVELRYRPHLPKVLDNVSFRVPAGQRTGLIGRTGSGKSTCMLALLRMVELSGGRVLLDGEDVSHVPLELLRGHALAIIPQDPFLFAGTVQENLDPFGRTSPREQEEVLSRAHLKLQLTDTVQGRGANFSVGQRQLLCIARALLRRAPVVLLDEASANIDAVTDSLMQQTLRSSFGASTLMIIAHRLSTVADADLIVCMDRGRAVEVGPPAELLRAGGLVARMFADAGEELGLGNKNVLIKPTSSSSEAKPKATVFGCLPFTCTSDIQLFLPK